MTDSFEEISAYVDGHSVEELIRNGFEKKLQDYSVEPQDDCLPSLYSAFDSYQFSQYLPNSTYFIDAITDIKRNLHHYAYVYNNLLKDGRSRETYALLLRARLFLSAESMGDAYTHYDSQYFLDDFFHFQAGEVLLDCGAYTGDTTLEFVQKHPDFDSIHLFEPSHEILERARKNVGELEENGDVFLHENAVGSAGRTVSFCEGTAHGDGKVCPAGKDDENSVVEVPIDELAIDNVSIIKMDLEGYERQALTGAAKTIVRDNPKMMISLYHLADDLWRLPTMIESISPDYDFYIRHLRKYQFYSTVLYCVPTSGRTPCGRIPDASVIERRLRFLDRYCVVPTEEDEGVNFNTYYGYLLYLTASYSKLQHGLAEAYEQGKKEKSAADDRIGALNAEILEKDRKLSALSAEAEEKNLKITALSCRLAEDNSRITALSSELEERNERVAALTGRLEESTQRAQRAEARLEKMFRSRLIRAVMKLRRFFGREEI